MGITRIPWGDFSACGVKALAPEKRSHISSPLLRHGPNDHKLIWIGTEKPGAAVFLEVPGFVVMNRMVIQDKYPGGSDWLTEKIGKVLKPIRPLGGIYDKKTKNGFSI